MSCGLNVVMMRPSCEAALIIGWYVMAYVMSCGLNVMMRPLREAERAAPLWRAVERVIPDIRERAVLEAPSSSGTKFAFE